MFGFRARLLQINLVSLGSAILVIIYSRAANFSARTNVVIFIVYAAIIGLAASYYEKASMNKIVRKQREKEKKKADAADAYEAICGKM